MFLHIGAKIHIDDFLFFALDTHLPRQQGSRSLSSFALSDPLHPEFAVTCQHHHDLVCVTCEQIKKCDLFLNEDYPMFVQPWTD